MQELKEKKKKKSQNTHNFSCVCTATVIHLGLVSLVASVTVVGPLIRVGSHVFAYVSDGFIQLAALAAFIPPLADVDLHVLL